MNNNVVMRCIHSVRCLTLILPKNFSDTDTITMFEFSIDIIFDGRDFQQIVVPSGHYGFHSFPVVD
jgi:hypothetical protein